MALCPLPGSRPAWAATPFTLTTYSPTRGLYRTASGSGLENENSGRLSGERFGDLARGIAADFFVGDQEDGDGPRECSVPGLQSGNGIEHERDTRLHIEDAGAMHLAIGSVAGHVG
jgi:hypothetical protein